MERVKSLNYNGKRHIPLPTGPHTVACMDIMTKNLKFGVFIRLYYPSRNDNILNRYLQWPLWSPHKQYINGYAARKGIPSSFYQFFYKYFVGKLYIPAVWQGDLQKSTEKYPVIILSHGLSGWRTTYSALCLELASYGFVVAAIEHRDYSASASFYIKHSRMSKSGRNPGSSLCVYDEEQTNSIEHEVADILSTKCDYDNEKLEIGPCSHSYEWILYQSPSKQNEAYFRDCQVKHRAKECSGALDLIENLNRGNNVENILDANFSSTMFKKKLDMKNIFFVGHSFGGTTGIVSLATEKRFKAGILLDPWMFPFYDDTYFSMVSKPFLCLLVESFQTQSSLQTLKRLKDLQKEGTFILMKNASHGDLCDAPFVPKCSLSLSTMLGLTIERFSALDIASDLIFQYLSQYLGRSVREVNLEIEKLKENYLETGDFL